MRLKISLQLAQSVWLQTQFPRQSCPRQLHRVLRADDALDFKPVRLKPLSVETFQPKARVY